MAQPNQGQTGGGAENYPFDANARAQDLDGLDRLRAVADRGLARDLYVLYAQAEANSRHVGGAKPEHVGRENELRRTAVRALDGVLGSDAAELASFLLLDQGGHRRLDEPRLRVFADRLRALQRTRP